MAAVSSRRVVNLICPLISAPEMHPRHKIHFRAFPYKFRMWLAIWLPRGLIQLLYRLMLRRIHPCADRESNRPARSIHSVLIPKPVDQVTFVARRISTKVVSRYGLREGSEGTLGHVERLHHSGHITIAKLVGQHHVHLCPHG